MGITSGRPHLIHQMCTSFTVPAPRPASPQTQPDTCTVVFWALYLLVILLILPFLQDGSMAASEVLERSWLYVTFGMVFWFLVLPRIAACFRPKRTPPLNHRLEESTSPDQSANNSLRIDDQPLPALTEPAMKHEKDLELGPPSATPLARTKPKIFFLDNIKIFLTGLVVVHHVAGMWRSSVDLFATVYTCTYNTSVVPQLDSIDQLPCMQPENAIADISNTFFTRVFALWLLDLNQSYFMALFFFISAYFMPASLSRKGAVVFITERVKRLGLPFIAWYVFLGPVLLITLELKMMLFGMDNPFDGYSEYWVMGGPPWFIGILLLFNVTYTAIRSEEYDVPLPSVGLMLFAGFVVGILMHATGGWGASFFYFPGGMCSIVWYIIFFMCGCVAKRGQWVESVDKLPHLNIAVCGILVILIAWFRFYTLWSAWKQAAIPRTSDLDMDVLKGGVFPIAVCICVVWGFQRFLNSTGRITKMFAEAAYAVYIIHPLIIFPCFYATVNIIKACQWATVFNMVKTPPTAFQLPVPAYFLAVPMGTSEEGVVWFGFVITALLSMVVVWPVAYLLRKLPLLRDVL